MNEQEYVTALISPLIDSPSELVVSKTTDEKGVLLMISVAASDMGKVIGKQGNTATSLRNLVRQFGAARRMRIAIKIEEPVTSQTSQEI